jgi:acyl dehydratase
MHESRDAGRATGLDPAIVGVESDSHVHRYGWRDLALYALSVGAEIEQDLDLVYEGHAQLRGEERGPIALPTYAVVPAFAAVRDLQHKLGGSARGLLHASQRILLHRPLRAADCLRTRAQVSGIHDMRRFAQSTLVTRTEDERGELVAQTEWTVFHTRDIAPTAAPAPRRPSTRPPARAADITARHLISPSQAALYRLNGDDNPLHIDPVAAVEAGYDRPILHGLCTFGMSCLAMHRAGVPVRRIRRMEAQFRAPVYPGEILVVDLWIEPPRLFLRAHAELRPDAPALTCGYAELAA